MTISIIDAQANDAIATSHEIMGRDAMRAARIAKKFDRQFTARSFMEDAAFHFKRAYILWREADMASAAKMRYLYDELRRTIDAERTE